MTVCKYCKWFWGTEATISCEFIDRPEKSDVRNERNEAIIAPSSILRSECFGRIKMCQHPDCFKIIEKIDPVNGKTKVKKRIAGQAQFNANLSCKRFRKKWYKFWVY